MSGAGDQRLGGRGTSDARAKLLTAILIWAVLQLVGSIAFAHLAVGGGAQPQRFWGLTLAIGPGLALGAILSCSELAPRAGRYGRANATPNEAEPTRAPTGSRHLEDDPYLQKQSLIEEIDGDLAKNNEPGLLAIARFGDYDRIAAFDPDRANRALCELGGKLRKVARPGVRVTQLEHDCFVVWFPSTPTEQALAELRAISYVLNQDLAGGDIKAPHLHWGCAFYPRDAGEAHTLIARAHSALAGSNLSKFSDLNAFAPATADAARRAFSVEQDLRHAIVDEQFILHYQPIVNLHDGKVTGAEALLRWNHPERGLVSPGEFIPLLEQSDLMEDVGAWVLTNACRQASIWRRHGLGQLKIAVNVSARQFQGSGFTASVIRTLARYKLCPADLEIELTETAALTDPKATQATLGDLRALGVGVALDDFGVGFSSLSYLKSLPITKLKIDREFVTDVHGRSDSKAICSSLIALANGLGIEILAEGVEKRDELQALLALGCPSFQGFLLGRPEPSDEFASTISDPRWLRQLSSYSAFTAPQRRATGAHFPSAAPRIA